MRLLESQFKAPIKATISVLCGDGLYYSMGRSAVSTQSVPSPLLFMCKKSGLRLELTYVKRSSEACLAV